MEFKTTAKAVREAYGKKIRAGYCSMQELLAYENRKAYTSGVYGWNFDVYEIYNPINGGTYIITTGYRGMVGEPVDYDLLRQYETEAEKIHYSREIDYEAKPEKIRALLYEFLSKCA